MWKKDEAQPAQRVVQTERPSTPVKSTPTTQRATIGRSITIRGDVTGNEDLLIQGRVDGSVTLELHAIAVGSEGRVNADITGRVITIEGEVDGDLTAQEQIVLLGSARVQGDIKAPRVVLEDGATFRGLVDMGSTPAKTSDGGVQPGSGARKGNGAGGTDAEPAAPPSPKPVARSGNATGAGSGSGTPRGVGPSPVTDAGDGRSPGSRKGKAAAGPTGQGGG